jgi:oligopeptidase B
VDVINTMLDASLPLTTGEYEEWGNPNDKTYYDLHGLVFALRQPGEGKLPGHAGGDFAERQPGHVLGAGKYVAKLRTLKTDGNPLLLRVNMDAGHGGASGRYDYLKEIAFTYAFILGSVNIIK